MVQRSKLILISLLLIAVSGIAADRLAVLEFFGRYGCGYCSAAREAIATLREEMQGQAVLLDYDYDKEIFLHGRQDRFWAPGTTADYLPLAMVGSGYRTTSGWSDHEAVFRSMINDELARPARAAVTAYYRRADNSVRAYVDLRNLGTSDLMIDEEASIWLIAYEYAETEVISSRVHSTAQRLIPFDLVPGESTNMIVETPPIRNAYWAWMAALVLAEDRPGGSGAYDMLQAANALAAGLYATPERLHLTADRRSADLELTGPHVLSWSATSNVPWIEVTPASGTLPATPRVQVNHQLRPRSATEGSITFSATGDDMSFSTTVELSIGVGYRRTGRRVRPTE